MIVQKGAVQLSKYETVMSHNSGEFIQIGPPGHRTDSVRRWACEFCLAATVATVLLPEVVDAADDPQAIEFFEKKVGLAERWRYREGSRSRRSGCFAVEPSRPL